MEDGFKPPHDERPGTMRLSVAAQEALAQGVGLRYRHNHANRQFGQELRAKGGDDPHITVLASLFQSWGHISHGEVDQARAALANAGHAQEGLDFHVGLVAMLVEFDLRGPAGHTLQGFQAIEAALDQHGSELLPAVQHALLTKAAGTLEVLGRYDDSLRFHYRAVAGARRLAVPGVLASALGALGGLQLSLLNLDDALELCREAWATCSKSSDYFSLSMAGHNLINVCSHLGLHEEALGLVAELLPLEPRFPTRTAPVRLSLCAHALAGAGQLDRAQACLDQSRAALPQGASPRAEWVWIQGKVFNASTQHATALELVAPYLAEHGEQLNESRFPQDLVQLNACAAQACEALGDYRAALQYEQQASLARTRASKQAAHTRRLSLQIANDLEAARRLRDEALRESERVQQEQQRLAELNAQLEAANMAKTRFLAAASHDLRQPVQALSMYMAALQQEEDAASQRALVQRMSESLQALSGLFNVLLDVSRLDAGLVKAQAEPVELVGLLKRLVDENQRPAQTKGLDLRLHLPRGLAQASAWSDPALLESMLRNLVDNALKYTQRGGVVLRLQQRAACWRVEVRDTGIGIALEQQALVFQEFFQVENPARDRSQGLGLGLSIVKRIAGLMDHALGLRSRAGRGSCFFVDLPVSDVALPATQPEPATQGNLLTLAVVDDDAAVRDSLRELLARWGHQVLVGDSAAAVLQTWQAQGRPRVDASIMDLRLPNGRTGLQALNELREHWGPGLKSLVITGDTEPQRLQLLSAANQDWLAKPVLPMRLRSWLRTVQPLSTQTQ